MTDRVSVGSGGVQGNALSSIVGVSAVPAMSADGRYVVFYSEASNLVAGDTNAARDIFVRDMVAGTTVRVSVDSNGVQGNADSCFPSITPDGRFVTFCSDASNLVANDT